MTKFQYIPTASGNVSLPQLNLMLFAKNDEQAIELSQAHAQAMSKAGYFRFWLTGSTTDALGTLAGAHLHRQLGELYVKTPEPVALFNAK